MNIARLIDKLMILTKYDHKFAVVGFLTEVLLYEEKTTHSTFYMPCFHKISFQKNADSFLMHRTFIFTIDSVMLTELLSYDMTNSPLCYIWKYWLLKTKQNKNTFVSALMIFLIENKLYLGHSITLRIALPAY